MTKDRPGAVWGKKHYNIQDVSQYHLEPAPFIVDAVPFLKEQNVKTILDAGCGQGRNSLYQRIKGTPGITGLSRPRVHIDGVVWHLDVGSSHPGAG